MGFVEDELKEVKNLCERHVLGSKLVACVKSMVRVEIKRTQFKSLVACIQFDSKYPATPLLLELKSKTLSETLLQRLNSVCEQEAKKLLEKAQVLKILIFIRNFIDENPLCCCYDEINILKKHFIYECDELKLRQKSSSLILKIVNGKYYFSTKIGVPDNYPDEAIELQDVQSNFPIAFIRHIVGQANEIARQHVEAPLKKSKPNELCFKPTPSLRDVTEFLSRVRELPNEKCQYCKEQCLPKDPNLLVNNESSPQHVERIYCGHLFHQDCLFKYLKTPPFGNKKCIVCGEKIFHHRWSLSDKLVEARWAHAQARERELAEVEDFFK